MKILAINFGGLGDEILFLPTLKSIKLEHPDWHITLLTEPRSSSITDLTALIDQNIVFDIKKKPFFPCDYWQLITLVKKGNYDLVLSSGSSVQVCLLLFLSQIKKRVGYNSGMLSRLLLSSAVPLNKEQYAANMYHDLVKGLGINRIPEPPEINVRKESHVAMQNFLNHHPAVQHNDTVSDIRNETSPYYNKRVILHPGTSKLALSKGIIKTWAAENWCLLIRHLLSLKCQVVLAGGPDDENTIKEITHLLRPEISHNFINAYGATTNVSELAALMQLGHLIICVDSAPMHIAQALRKPVIALFGPTNPNKLLCPNPFSIALSESSYKNTKKQSGVQILPAVVFQTVEDQLKQISNQAHSEPDRKN